LLLGVRVVAGRWQSIHKEACAEAEWIRRGRSILSSTITLRRMPLTVQHRVSDTVFAGSVLFAITPHRARIFASLRRGYRALGGSSGWREDCP
jgi:hypothetical protein